MTGDVLIYGVTGFTGELIARAVVEKGLYPPPILAGRKAERVASLASQLKTDFRVFALDKPGEVLEGLKDVRAVLNCASPFSRTAEPMIDACLEAKAHYLDINGEIDVIEQIRARDAEAVARGIMLMPGIGLNVPSDLLAAHVKGRLPTANRLSLAVKIKGAIGRGTMEAILEQLTKGAYIRRNGRLEKIPTAWKVREFPTRQGYVRAASFAFGDLSTAYYTTGIPNIDTMVVLPWPVILAMKASAPCMPMLGWPLGMDLRSWYVEGLPAGPDADTRAFGRATYWAEAADEDGRRVLATLDTPEGYTVTVTVAVALAQRLNRGKGIATPGFQTVGRMYSPDVILDWTPGVTRTDVF